MAASEAQILANRQNAVKSTGPKTLEGKESSRRNGLKHGLAGQGVVIPEADAGEIERRTAALHVELAPRSTLGSVLIEQMAFWSVRMERGGRHESAALGRRVRHATDDFDDDQLDKADRLFETLDQNPRSHLRKLRRMPAGIDRLITAWDDLRTDLARDVWTPRHRDRAENLVGRSSDEFGGSRLKPLGEAILGNFGPVADEDQANLDAVACRAWASERLIEEIDTEIAGLEALFDALDHERLDLDRREAATRALFDPSSGATLARRYEAAANRAFFRALIEFRKIEAEALANPTPAQQAQPAPPLASSRQDRAPVVRDPIPTLASPARTIDPGPFETARTLDGRVVTIGRAQLVPA